MEPTVAWVIHGPRSSLLGGDEVGSCCVCEAVVFVTKEKICSKCTAIFYLYMFDNMANPVVHLLLLESSMTHLNKNDQSTEKWGPGHVMSVHLLLVSQFFKGYFRLQSCNRHIFKAEKLWGIAGLTCLYCLYTHAVNVIWSGLLDKMSIKATTTYFRRTFKWHFRTYVRPSLPVPIPISMYQIWQLELYLRLRMASAIRPS